MMKPLAALSLAVSLFALGCGAAPSDDGSTDETSDDISAKKKKDPLAPVTTVIPFDVAINSSTIHTDGTSVRIDVPLLWKYTRLSHQPLLSDGIPASEESGCKQSCVNALIARAKANGGVLSGTLTVERSFRDFHHDDGTCALGLEETISLDLKKAAHGIAPIAEELYDWLVVSDGSVGSVELYPKVCPTPK